MFESCWYWELGERVAYRADPEFVSGRFFPELNDYVQHPSAVLIRVI